jgi:hypothetical protein
VSEGERGSHTLNGGHVALITLAEVGGWQGADGRVRARIRRGGRGNDRQGDGEWGEIGPKMTMRSKMYQALPDAARCRASAINDIVSHHHCDRQP